MPRFHFHVYDQFGSTLDAEGRHLPDLATARAEAIKGVRSILSHEVSLGLIDLRGRIEVADGDSQVLLSIPFAEAVELRRP